MKQEEEQEFVRIWFKSSNLIGLHKCENCLIWKDVEMFNEVFLLFLIKNVISERFVCTYTVRVCKRKTI